MSASGRRVRATYAAAALLLLVAGLAAAPPAQAEQAASDDATSQHGFADVDHWTGVFDDPERDAWQKPDELVQALEIEPGMTVADLGAGTGYLSRRLSRAVGASGTVFAVDPEPRLVEHLRERAEREETANLVPVLASKDNPRLPAGGIDRILLLDTYHHVDDRRAYFRALRRALRPGGRLAVIDWQKRPLPVGPGLDHKLSREQVVAEMSAAGWTLAAEPDFLPYQYFLIFQTSAAPDSAAISAARRLAWAGAPIER